MDFIKWLYPGIGIKRWLLLGVVGFILVAASMSLITDNAVLGFLEIKMKEIAVQYLGGNIFWAGIIILFIGSILLALGFREVVRAFIKGVFPDFARKQVRPIHQQIFLRRGPKIVVIGGGTGLSVLLRGLKEYTSNITAIVSVADDGGSSGRLRNQLGMLPPGDIRNCLVALADREVIMEEMFNYRFKHGKDLEGHNLGNLILAAMVDMYGSFEEGVRQMSKVLAIRGKVVPSTLQHMVLRATLEDGSMVVGESNIAKSTMPIRRVTIVPSDAKPVDEALEAIAEGDMIIFGPGSLYTSIIPNLLVSGMTDAIKASKAPKVYICNVMTQPGETKGYTASQHLKAILDHGGENIIDYILVNSQPISNQKLINRYFADSAEQVEIDHEQLQALGVNIVEAHLLDEGDLIRHNTTSLANAIMLLLLKKKSFNTGLSFIDRLVLLEKIKNRE